MKRRALAHIADLHINERRRPEDTSGVLAEFVEAAGVAGVDLIVVSGDFFHRKSSPVERLMLADFLEAATAVAPVFGVRGNHDAPGDLALFDRLHPRVTIAERPGPAVVYDHTPGTRFACVGLPWFDKASCVARTGSRSAADSNELAMAGAASVLEGVAAEVAWASGQGMIPVLVGHVLVAGSTTSTGQTLVGTTVELGPAALAETGAEYVALGHVHKRQGFMAGPGNHDGRVHYSGSPERHNFGEDEPKGWNLVEFNGRDLAGVEFVELESARAIALLDADWTAEAGAEFSVYPAPPFDRGALVRFRYRIEPDKLGEVDEAAIRERYLAAGAQSVTFEAVLAHRERIRSDEIATARTTFEKIEAYWAATGVKVDVPTRVRVKQKLVELERAGELEGVGLHATA